jgi:hypothetical protein
MEENIYQQILGELNLRGEIWGDSIFQYINREFSVPDDESCQKFLGMLSIIYPDLDYDKVSKELFSDTEDNPTRTEKIMSFIKRMVIKEKE